DYMRAALESSPQRERPLPQGLSSSRASGRTDYYYAENPLPVAPTPEVPDWLREMFASDSQPVQEAPQEAIPPVAPAQQVQVPRMQMPAPVEERTPVIIRR